LGYLFKINQILQKIKKNNFYRGQGTSRDGKGVVKRKFFLRLKSLPYRRNCPVDFDEAKIIFDGAKIFFCIL
jgi:hypothetical protein